MTPRSPTPMIVGHCDRYVVTVASPPTSTDRRRQPVFASRCILPDTEPVRPSRGPESDSQEHASRLVAPDQHVLSADAVAPKVHLYSANAP